MKWMILLMATLACLAELAAQTPDVTVEEASESRPPEVAASSDAATHSEVQEDETAESAAVPTETSIDSDRLELGLKSRSAVYRGNVRLIDPRLQLTCEQLTAFMPEDSRRVESVIAETNVVILMVDDEGKTHRAFADKAVYTYKVTEQGTNEMVVLSGDDPPRIERDASVLYGDTITWDRIKNTVDATNPRMVYRPAPGELGSEGLVSSSTNAGAEGETEAGELPPTDPASVDE